MKISLLFLCCMLFLGCRNNMNARGKSIIKNDTLRDLVHFEKSGVVPENSSIQDLMEIEEKVKERKRALPDTYKPVGTFTELEREMYAGAPIPELPWKIDPVVFYENKYFFIGQVIDKMSKDDIITKVIPEGTAYFIQLEGLVISLTPDYVITRIEIDDKKPELITTLKVGDSVKRVNEVYGITDIVDNKMIYFYDSWFERFYLIFDIENGQITKIILSVEI